MSTLYVIGSFIMQKYFRIFIILAIAAIIAVMPVSGEDNSTTFTIDQLLHMERAGPFSLSSDGVNLVYLKSEGTDLLPEFTNRTVILSDLRSGQDYRLSGDSETALSFALSPKGRQVAYTAVQKDGGDTVFKVVSLTDLKSSALQNVSPGLLSGFSWLNEEELLFTETASPEAGDQLDQLDQINQSDQRDLLDQITITAGYYDDTIVMDEIPKPVILKKYSLKTGITEPVSANNDVITIYSPSPDGRYILYKSSVYPEEWRSGALFRYVLLNTFTGEEKPIFNMTEGFEDENAIVWAPDSSVVYIERMHNGGMEYPIRYTTDVLA